MLQLDDVVHIVLLSAMDLFAMVVNAMLIYIIRTRTPNSLHPYSALLFIIAFVDFIAAFSSFMTIVSIRNISGFVILVHVGPCAYFSPQLCHLFLAIRVNLLGQSVLLLMISFSFRLWILKIGKNKDIAKISCRLWTAIIFAITLALINTASIYLSGSYEMAEVDDNRSFSVLPLGGGITDNILPRISVFAVIITNSIGFIAIFVIRRKLFIGIEKLKSSDRYSHQMIFRSLTAQMILPLAYIIGTLLWMLDLLGIVQSRTLQRGTFILSSIFGIGSPLINMHYVPPYRKYLHSLFFRESHIPPIAAVKLQKESNL